MWFTTIPDKPTPIGCLVGFFALFLVAYSAMAFWGAYRAFTRQPPLPDTGKKLILWGIMALVPALVGMGFCIHRLRTAGT
jgi:hypothetical protein